MTHTLVLLPGMDGTGELFAPLVAALGSDVPTVVVRYPDLPLGYGEHLAFARAKLPRDRPYVVLGESFSGPVAIALAATSPPGMIGYVLCASFVRSPGFWLRVFRPLLGALSPRTVPDAIAAFFLMGRFASKALRRTHTDTLRGVSSRALSARLNAIASVDVREDLGRVRMPGLYLRATHDRLVPRAASREFEQLATSSRIVDIEGPHFLLQTRPVEAAAALKAFLSPAKVTDTFV